MSIQKREQENLAKSLNQSNICKANTKWKDFKFNMIINYSKTKNQWKLFNLINRVNSELGLQILSIIFKINTTGNWYREVGTNSLQNFYIS